MFDFCDWKQYVLGVLHNLVLCWTFKSLDYRGADGRDMAVWYWIFRNMLRVSYHIRYKDLCFLLKQTWQFHNFSVWVRIISNLHLCYIWYFPNLVITKSTRNSLYDRVLSLVMQLPYINQMDISASTKNANIVKVAISRLIFARSCGKDWKGVEECIRSDCTFWFSYLLSTQAINFRPSALGEFCCF